MISADQFVLGVNYWPRRKAMYWWKTFDLGEVREEFAQIAAYGLRVVRFCLLWEDFQPSPTQVDPGRLDDLIAVMDAAFEVGLRAIPTLVVGNMSGVMWFPCWAFSDQPEERTQLQRCDDTYIHRKLRSPFGDPELLRAQARLAAAVAATVGQHPALHSWDLANEIDAAYMPEGADVGWLWAWCVSRAIRSVTDDALVTYGAHDMSLKTCGLTIPALAPSLDYLSMHGYPIYSDIARGPLDAEFVPYVTLLTAQLGDKPALMQEFGLPTTLPGQPSCTIEDDFLGHDKPQFLASEEDAARYYARVLDRLWETGSKGAMAWIYADYVPELWSKPPLDRARRERTFGLFRSDGTPKPAAEVVHRFAAELESGELAQRLGPRGAKAVSLDVIPEAYYQDPAESYRAGYRRYLDKVEAGLYSERCG